MKHPIIMVFGTFDVLHSGHIALFKQARALVKNPQLVVSIARGVNVKRIKGFLPSHSEQERIDLVANCRLVDKVVLGDRTDYKKHILEVKPDIIALGYDQRAYVKELEKDFGKTVRIVRLKAYKSTVYKTSKLFKR